MEAGGSMARSSCRHGGPRGAAVVRYHLDAAQTAVAALVGGGSLAASATSQKMSQGFLWEVALAGRSDPSCHRLRALNLIRRPARPESPLCPGGRGGVT